MGILRAAQLSLESLHDIETDLDVGLYLVGDEVRAEIPGAIAELPEQLFVCERDGELELALYISPAILAGLNQDDPRVRLHEGNLQAYCILVEGVSHFVLVAHRAGLGRPVTALELEIQAEVDKFVHTWLLLVEQGARRGAAAAELHRRLFDGWELRDEIQAAERDRYQVANRVAKHFCRGLVGRFGADEDAGAMKREVRDFFRQGLATKLRAA